jgi:hypothetical protein
MSWDPTLLRKFSSTNHYKLLNQVRSDLKEQPITRSTGSSSRRGGGASAASRNENVTDRGSDRGRDRDRDRERDRERGHESVRRRSVPAPIPQQATAANSFDPIVTVPVLIAPFE